tara:strand:- start:1542 stop:2243 length:702 start_codon:yes stop_codon:yes gene_type:complete
MVNVDRVYQRVLALANKEQRGYITPQEFNLLANHAQMDIFEQYFYDLNQFRRLPGNDTGYADMITVLEEKINLFLDSHSPTSTGSNNNIFALADDFYRLSEVRYGEPKVEVERLTSKEFNLVRNSPLTAPTLSRPVYYQKDTRIIMFPPDPNGVDDVNIMYIRRPATVSWGSTMAGGVAIYNDGLSINFELHPSEETELVIKILSLAGITIKDQGLYQIAAGEDVKNIQQEKQ